MNIPQIATKWLHENGVEYTVFDLLNLNADEAHAEKYPVIVCYRDPMGNKWGKTVPEFLRRRTLVEKKPSAWQARKALFTPKTSGVFSEPEAMQMVTPEIQIYDPNSTAIGAFAYVHHRTTSDTVQERHTLCLNLVAELWTKTWMNQGTVHSAPVYDNPLQLDPASAVTIDNYLDKNVTFIGTTEREVFVTDWKTSYGGSLRDLNVFVSVLLQMQTLLVDSEYLVDVQMLRKFKDTFNRLIDAQVTNHRIKRQNAPAAVLIDNKLRIMLPEDILGPNNSEVQYAECRMVGTSLKISFPPRITELLFAIYSKVF